MESAVEIWIEDANGTRLGSGPLMSALNVTETDRLNAAGEFAFSVPTSDPQADLIRSHRYARLWHFAPLGGWQQVGYGRIERITNSIGPDGIALLNVAGGNELALLGDRICNNLSLSVYKQRHPAMVWWAENQPSGTTPPRQLSNVTDGDVDDAATTDSIKGYYGCSMRVSAANQFDRITFAVTSGQGTVGHPAFFYARYYDTEAEAYQDVDIDEDTTVGYYSTNKLSLKQSGYVRFEPPATWGIVPGETAYHIELRVTNGSTDDTLDPVTLSDITTWATETADDPLGLVMAFTPDGWGLDLGDGYATVQGRPYGPELLTNGGFETITGTPDDATSDTFTGWTNVGTGAAAQILAVTDEYAGTYAIKLNRTTAAAYIYQAVTVSAGLDYTLEFWTHGDGTGAACYRVLTGTDFAPGYTEIWDISGLVDTGITGATWERVRYTFTMPAGITTVTIAFYTPALDGEAAWIDAVSLRSGGGDAIYLQMRDESVLQAITRIAQSSAENFILSPAGKKVLWLGRDVRNSELRAVAVEVAGYATAPNQLVLLSLSESEDASRLISRLYPYGGGMGAERVTLNEATQPPPTGYTLSKEYNYLERDAAVTALGIIEAVQSWSDIVPQASTDLQRQNAANALLVQAWQYLETHSATDTDRKDGDVPRFYSASVVKSERMILPGFTLRLQYDQWREDLQPIRIDRDVWVTGVARQIGGDGVNVVGLELATVPRWVESDAQIIARNLIGLGKLASHNTAEAY